MESVCLAHSGIVQKIEDQNKVLDRHDKEIAGLKKSVYMASGAMMVVTPIATVYLQHVFK